MATSRRPQRNEPRRKITPAEGAGKPRATPIRLVATEVQEDGILLVFDAGGKEVGWLLEQTSILEFFALILEGQMREGKRLIVRGDITLEPPEGKLKLPMVCFSGAPLQTCVPITRPALKALRDEIDHVLSLRG